ncbi:MAG: hypothetical protein R2800_00125 [Flavipsychrobacter sp.]
MRNGVLILLLFLAQIVAAQEFEDTSIFKYPIQMDNVVIKASRSGWDVQGFIKRVQEDTTFYKAFKTMRIMAYNATNDIKVYNKKGRVAASYYSKTRQHRTDDCRTMEVLDEKVKGNYYKNKKKKEHRYFTTELYEYLFFTEGKICGETDVLEKDDEEEKGGMIGRSVKQLKQLMFNPGSKVSGVPFMGDRAAIFEPDIAKMYNFKLLSEEYNGVECYLFKAIPKPEYKNKVVYNNLSTWFRKSDYSIVARDYSLSFKTMVYDFDVTMKVRTRQVGDKLLPTYIDYNGNWHVFSKKRERVRFINTITY